jgi:hypothetical protein
VLSEVEAAVAVVVEVAGIAEIVVVEVGLVGVRREEAVVARAPTSWSPSF